MDEKKQLEMECFGATRAYADVNLSKKARKYLYSLLPYDLQINQSERPDFVLKDGETTYLLEHFMVDFCYDGQKNNQSESRRASRELRDIYREYHDPNIGTIKDCDIDDAVSTIEGEINKMANLHQKFDYEKYVQAFRRVFLEHYKRIPEYRNNDKIMSDDIKVGFLIEFHCDTCMMNAVLNDSLVYLKGTKKPFPMTRDILSLFREADDLDFIILSQFDEGVMIEPRSVSVFEPKNIEKSLEIQRIKVFDRVFYLGVTKNIKLDIDKEP